MSLYKLFSRARVVKLYKYACIKIKSKNFFIANTQVQGFHPEGELKKE